MDEMAQNLCIEEHFIVFAKSWVKATFTEELVSRYQEILSSQLHDSQVRPLHGKKSLLDINIE